ncbi:MAG TPA: hypothetical protein VJ904_04690, partial [Tichowtungia sp.]|nr:hypothetical protein [Tichowtungia sp.]
LTATNYIDTTALNDITYYYKVSAVDTSGNESEKSSEVSETPFPDTVPPAAPTGLLAASGDNEVFLQWTANGEEDLAGYSVYRSTVSGVYTNDALTNGLSETTYLDSTALNSNTYYYGVSASDTSDNESAQSSQVSATPTAVPPVGSSSVFEPFDYPAGSLNGVTATGIGLSGDWSSGSMHQIASGSLFGIPGYGFMPTGNRLTLLTDGWGAASVSLDSENTINFGASSVTYFSFLADFGGKSGFPRFRFKDGSETVASMTFKDSEIELNSETMSLDPAFPSYTTVLVVGKFETFANDSLSDIFSVSFFTDVSGGEPAEWNAVQSAVVTAGTVVDTLEIYVSYASQVYQLDEFRIGPTFDSVVSEAALTGYDQWASGWGTDIGAATNDHDGDGLSNFGEYALGGDPANAQARGSKAVFKKSGSGFIYVHPKRSDDGSITYTVETCTNLMTGMWMNSGSVAVGTNVTGGELDFVTNEVDTIENENFIRLKIQQ